MRLVGRRPSLVDTDTKSGSPGFCHCVSYENVYTVSRRQRTERVFLFPVFLFPPRTPTTVLPVLLSVIDPQTLTLLPRTISLYIKKEFTLFPFPKDISTLLVFLILLFQPYFLHSIRSSGKVKKIIWFLLLLPLPLQLFFKPSLFRLVKQKLEITFLYFYLLIHKISSNLWSAY